MESICLMGYHTYCKNLVNASWKKFNETPLPSDGTIMGALFDWKENVFRGRGPNEDSSVVHNLQATAAFGLVIFYYCPSIERTAKLHIPILTDVLDKTAEAARGLLSFALDEVLKQEWFIPIWERVETIRSFADIGRHFRSEVFLHYALIDLVNKFRTKTHEHDHIQYRHDEHDRRALLPTSTRCLHVNGAVVQASPGVKWAGCEETGRHQAVVSEAPGSPLQMDASTQVSSK
jgi:hypothetical protein